MMISMNKRKFKMLYTSSENQFNAEYFQQENIQWNIIHYVEELISA